MVILKNAILLRLFWKILVMLTSKKIFSIHYFFVENFYIFDKTSTFSLLENTAQRTIIKKKNKKIKISSTKAK